jgi:hypothetical protein
MMTLIELKEKIIQQFDEVDLIDLLGLTTEDLVNAFEDVIELKYQSILKELEFNSDEEE